MSIEKDLSDLVKANIITDETADKIQAYYQIKERSSGNRLFVVFGILGAILVGLGIILMIAHNWDELSKSTKTFFAFLQLFLGQLLCGFTIIRKSDSIAWRESSAAFLFFAIGSTIALISQIYHLPGDLSSFLLTWMLLCWPLIYLMKSSVVSLLYIIGITYYASYQGYWTYPSATPYIYWGLLAITLPHYYQLYKHSPVSNFMIFHNWLIPLSLIITLGTIAKSTEELMFIAYISLLGIFYMMGCGNFFTGQKPLYNGYKIIGALGTIGILLALSFDWFWKMLQQQSMKWEQVYLSPEFMAAVFLSSVAAVLFIYRQKGHPLSAIRPVTPAFAVFILAFVVGLSSTTGAMVLINLLLLVIGIRTIQQGAKEDHLGILNFGLFIITALVTCRFFDSELSFITRGALFIMVGAGFIATNYRMLNKRKSHVN